jgi:hypothetical protein
VGLGVKPWLVAVVLLAGCDDDYVLFGPPTETVCPTDSTLTYENFGREFMEDYCTKCHDSALVGSDRMGAPSFHDFDTVFGIRAVSNHIDETAAAGPASINEGMPREAPFPTLDERYLLGEWVACGMPSTENP